MLLPHLVTLALIQGITEFLPISSSAHLILLPYVTGWPDQGVVIDVAVHLGTLCAVVLYFRAEVWGMAAGGVGLLRGRSGPGVRLALQIALATLPAVAVGLALHEFAPDLFRMIPGNERFVGLVIAGTTIGFGLLLWIVDRACLSVRRVEHLTYGDALMIGVAQAVALIPGTSRSGITMTAGRLLGMERTEAARYSMLLSIPVILAAGSVATLDVLEAGDLALGIDALMAAALAFLSAWIAIAVLMRWLRVASFLPFVIYRLILGTVLLLIFL